MQDTRLRPCGQEKSVYTELVKRYRPLRSSFVMAEIQITLYSGSRLNLKKIGKVIEIGVGFHHFNKLFQG